MTHSDDLGRPRRRSRHIVSAALVVLAAAAWVRPVSATDEPGRVGAGPVATIVIDPHTPTTLYAGIVCAGVLKSTDRGSTWAAINTGLPSIGVRALAIDPIRPSTLYTGTFNGGVFKSTDGARNWAAVNAGLTATVVSALAIDPITPGTLYAGHYGGVSKSTDGASSWHAVNAGLTNTGVGALAIDPATPSTLYVATKGGVFTSTDGGNSWRATGLGGDVICGDGLASTGCGERCDDGNTVSGDGCDSNCTPTGCGNGVLTVGEECDDGSRVDRDGCDSDCTPTACGNSIVTLGEECDDGNRVDGDGCDSNCTATRCGNGIVTAGEECDDGNGYPFDGCTNACTICGNGIVTPPEECDGNTNPADGCTDACTICGNGIVTVPEGCDDGNLADGDGCAANCIVPNVCGNAFREADEECDDGGVCIGGANAGTFCTAHRQCEGGECATFGGDGCAANCTLESDVTFNSVPGVPELDNTIAPGTSGAVIHGDILIIPLPFSGSQTLTIGKERDGHIPVVIRAAGVHLARVSVLGLGGSCFCPRAVAAKTCGGMVLEADGVTQSPDCTPRFTAGDSVCAGKHPCAFLHGPGNSASGVIGCNGLDGVNVSLTQDSGGSSGTSRPPRLTLSGTGGSGAAMLFATTAIGSRVLVGLCTGQDASVYGPDGEFCTDDDPQSQRGNPLTVPVTTGTASGQVFNANMSDGNTIGPFSATGHPFNCSALAGGSASDAALASVSVELAQQTVGDAVTTNLLVAAPGPPLVGDCHGDGQVTVDELLTMVNIVLGTARLSACPHGVPSGSGVNVALVIQAVNNALTG